MNTCGQPGEAFAAMDNRSQFVRTAAADASGAARTRSAFASWLQRHFSLREEQLSDLVLAVNEALANAAEFGYVDTAGDGIIEFTASYDQDIDTLAATITDEGRWRSGAGETPTTPTPHALRGRGIALMRALADETRIDTSEGRTQVSLTWTNLLTPSRHLVSVVK